MCYMSGITCYRLVWLGVKYVFSVCIDSRFVNVCVHTRLLFSIVPNNLCRLSFVYCVARTRPRISLVRTDFFLVFTYGEFNTNLDHHTTSPLSR